MKISFHSHDFTPEYLLNVYRKMTPGKSGKWKKMQAVTDPEQADVHVIIDDCHLRLPDRSRLYIGAHPPGTTSYVDKRGLRSEKSMVIDQSEGLGFCEWWLESDYDFLAELEVKKDYQGPHYLICILSNSNDRPYHKTRREHVEKLIQKDILKSLYGRIKPTSLMEKAYIDELGKWVYHGDERDSYWFGKDIYLLHSANSLEYDAHPTINYISERVFDAMLMWCRPLYWGSTNMHEFLPKGSFEYIDATDEGESVIEALEKPINYEAMAEARDLMLNKYQLWARIYEVLS